jgi:VWFA-related protein
MRLLKILIVPCVLAAAVFAQLMTGQEATPAPAKTASEQAVSVLFSATDGHGNPLRELTKDQVTVTENNQPAQTVQVQDASDLPLHLGIILLASKKKFDQEQAAAIDLAQKVLRPGKDKAFVITAGGEKPWPNEKIPWITDVASVADSIRALDKNAGLADLFNYQVTTDTASLGRMSLQTIQTTGGGSVFDIIWAVMKTDPRPARRAVVMFRLGSAHAPGFGERSTRANEENHLRVIRIAQLLGVCLFTIGVEDPLPAGDPSRSTIGDTYTSIHAGQTGNSRAYDQGLARQMDYQYSAGRDNVNRIADETGGRPYWTTKKNYTDAVAAISNELSARYVVSFVPAATPAAAPVHPIKVLVAGAAHVSAPRAYIVQQQN